MFQLVMTREHTVQWGKLDRISSDKFMVRCAYEVAMYTKEHVRSNIVISSNHLLLEVPDKPPFIV
jgi:hypothetical protein